MAKKSRQTKNDVRAERRERAEALRREQARKERLRSTAIFAGVGVVVVGLLAAAIIPTLQKRAEDKKLAGAALSSLGVSKAAASCSAEQTKSATGSGQHVNPGTTIDYPDHPPAFGKHWGNFLNGSEIRTFYSRKDRPQTERLVHSLEHGHTIIWYDDTVKAGTADYEAIQQITDKLGLSSYVMAAPYDKSDGGTLPDGKHVVLTHWTGPDNQKGIWQYCGKASGAVVADFVKKYPKTDTPEPGAA